MLAGCDDGGLRLLDIADGRELKRLDSPEQ